MNTPPLLETAALSLSVAGRTLVNYVSLRVEPGEMWCVLGANGCGKTTLLHTLLGIRPRQGGTIAMLGRPLAQWRGAEAARFRAFLPQLAVDAFSISVLDAAMAGRYPYLSRWEWEGSDDRNRAMAALDALGLSALAGRDVMTLSGGERQRVAIAALLVQDSPLMLLDEPLAHLDLNHQLMVLRHLRALVDDADRGIVFSLHDINHAGRFATHGVLFRDDGTVEVGRIDDVLDERALSLAFGCPIVRMGAGSRQIFVAG